MFCLPIFFICCLCNKTIYTRNIGWFNMHTMYDYFRKRLVQIKYIFFNIHVLKLNINQFHLLKKMACCWLWVFNEMANWQIYDWLRCSRPPFIFIWFSMISTAMYVIRRTPKTDIRTISIIYLMFGVLLKSKVVLLTVLCCSWFQVTSVDIIIITWDFRIIVFQQEMFETTLVQNLKEMNTSHQ